MILQMPLLDNGRILTFWDAAVASGGPFKNP